MTASCAQRPIGQSGSIISPTSTRGRGMASRATVTNGECLAWKPTISCTPLRATAAPIFRQPSRVRASGFSTKTCFPASAAATARRGCRSWWVAMTTASARSRTAGSSMLGTPGTSGRRVRSRMRSIADGFRPRFPQLAALLDEAESNVLAALAFPAEHWRQADLAVVDRVGCHDLFQHGEVPGAGDLLQLTADDGRVLLDPITASLSGTSSHRRAAAFPHPRPGRPGCAMLGAVGAGRAGQGPSPRAQASGRGAGDPLAARRAGRRPPAQRRGRARPPARP